MFYAFWRQSKPLKSVLIAIILVAGVHGLPVYAQGDALNIFVDGVEAFDIKDYDNAVAAFKNAIELKPDNLEYQYYLGMTYGRMDRLDDAINIFESLTKKDPVNYLKAYFDIANLYSGRGLYQKALETLDLAETANPGNTRIYLERGYTYNKIPDYDQAIKSFQKARDIDPKLTQRVYFDIALTHQQAEQFLQAEEMYRKAIEVDPKTPLAESARQTLPGVKTARRARKPWYLMSAFGWAYDDNIPVETLPLGPAGATQVSGTGDQFQTFMFRAGYKFINKKNFELGAGYMLSTLGYKEAIKSNTLAHVPHIYLQGNTDRIFWRIPYEFSYYLTGGPLDEANKNNRRFFLTFGEDADRKLALSSLIPSITIIEPYRMKTEIALGYQYKHYYDQTPNATNLSAGIIQSYQFPKPQFIARAGYKFTDEDASVDASSYRTNEILAGLSFPTIWKVMGDASLTYMRTDINADTVNNRSEFFNRSYIFTGTLSRVCYEYFLFQFIYNFTKNSSNLTDTATDVDLNKYRKNVFTLSVTFNY